MIPIRQNVDINARAQDFLAYELGETKLLVASYFPTIQGECLFAGHRAFFIRTSGCNFGAKNVACSWCDTDFRISNGTPMEFEALKAQAMIGFSSPEKPLIVVTGGEPLLQPNIVGFLRYMLEAGFVVQLETNGTFLHRVNDLAKAYRGLHVVCSPKQVRGRYAAAEPQGFDYTLSKNPVQFKFVVSVDAEAGHTSVPTWINEVAAYGWVSPMTVYRKAYSGEVSSVWDNELVDQQRTADNYRYAAELVMGNPNLKFTCQLHTLMAIA